MPEAAEFELHLEAPFGAVQHYDTQWIAWAQTTQAPAHGNVDHSLDPTFHDPNAGGETRYA
jgi:hypothetical protein